MPGKGGDLTVYQPETMGDLLNLVSRHPDAVIWAGGTYLMLAQRNRRLKYSGRVILLKRVEDLQKISRTERYIDIGACATIDEIVQTGHAVLPTIFIEALGTIGPKSIRGTATLGGNICVQDCTMTLFPVLQLLDASFEIKKQGSTRWVSPAKIRGHNKLDGLTDGEILTRIRIPFKEWNYIHFDTFGSAYVFESNPLVFSGLARSSRGILDDFRFSLSTSKTGIVRRKDLETELVGQRIPLTQREIVTFINRTEGNLLSIAEKLNNFQRERGKRLLKQFLENIGSGNI